MRVARFLQDRTRIGGESEDRRVLNSSNGGGSDSLALFRSTEHEGLIDSAKSAHH